MQPRPFPNNPFVGVWNPALPVPNGAVAGTFNAWGWLRQLINTGVPEAISDFNYYNSLSGGTFV